MDIFGPFFAMLQELFFLVVVIVVLALGVLVFKGYRQAKALERAEQSISALYKEIGVDVCEDGRVTYISEVRSKSFAEEAKMQKGDVVLAINGNGISHRVAISETLNSYKINFTLLRDGERLELVVKRKRNKNMSGE